MSLRTFGRGPVVAGLVGGLVAFSAGTASATLVFTETVAEGHIGRDRGVFILPGPSLLAGALDVLVGSFTIPAFPPNPALTASGKGFTDITTDLSTDTSLSFQIVAPAGQHFLVHQDTVFSFLIQFSRPGGATDRVLLDQALTVTLDGVPLTLDSHIDDDPSNDIGLVAIDDDGRLFTFEGSSGIIPAGTTFSTLAFTLDYSVDANGPITIAPGEGTFEASPESHIAFSYAEPTTSTETVLGPIITVVPEPASLALLTGAATLAFARRSRRR